MLSGPDGNSNFRSTVLGPSRYIGIGDMSPEGTSELSYLWRPSKVTYRYVVRIFLFVYFQLMQVVQLRFLVVANLVFLTYDLEEVGILHDFI